jgi:Cof subfamily protein (haloacid dehalogenase superfamily)
MDKEILDFGFDGLVCGCGTYITYKEAVLHQVSIPQATIQELISDLRKHKIEAILEGMTSIYYDSLITNTVLLKIKEEQVANFNVQNWDASDISIDKFCIWTYSEEDYQYFYKKYNDKFDFIKRSRSFYEVIPKGYSKATGIEILLKHLHIPQENTYALGDSTNDLSMLQCVKYSIAMGNSCKEILDLVSYVTSDVDQDGVANALKHYHII